MHPAIWIVIGAAAGWLGGRVLMAMSHPGRALLSDGAGELERQLGKLTDLQRHALMRFVERRPLRDPNASFDAQMTFGQKVADRVASFGGSWTFIGLFVAAMAVWIVLNSMGGRPVDPFPFILLNLMLSCLAALQAPVIMMSQNRQTAKDRHDAQLDYDVNVRAELEVSHLHEKLEQRDAWIGELMEINRRQLALLEQMAGGGGA